MQDFQVTLEAKERDQWRWEAEELLNLLASIHHRYSQSESPDVLLRVPLAIR